MKKVYMILVIILLTIPLFSSAATTNILCPYYDEDDYFVQYEISGTTYFAVSIYPFYVRGESIELNSFYGTVERREWNGTEWIGMSPANMAYYSVTNQLTDVSQIKYANHDIVQTELRHYTQDWQTVIQDKVVFFSPPETPLVKGVKRVQVLTLMTRLVAGLTAFMIGLWIASMEFSKAWQFLLTTLRRG